MISDDTSLIILTLTFFLFPIYYSYIFKKYMILKNINLNTGKKDCKQFILTVKMIHML